MEPSFAVTSISEQRLRSNVERIKGLLAENRYGDEPPAKLIAVTKNASVEVTNQLAKLMQQDIAENRVPALQTKMPYLDPFFKIHWIGRLQSNKIKSIIGCVSLIHSLDHMSVAEEIDRQAREIGRPVQVLVQVNVTGETQKGGVSLQELRPFLEALDGLPCLQVKGLMSIMQNQAPEALLRQWFREMRCLFDDLRANPVSRADMAELSMGMSGDFVLAAQEGATMVRIGSALFSR